MCAARDIWYVSYTVGYITYLNVYECNYSKLPLYLYPWMHYIWGDIIMKLLQADCKSCHRKRLQNVRYHVAGLTVIWRHNIIQLPDIIILCIQHFTIPTLKTYLRTMYTTGGEVKKSRGRMKGPILGVEHTRESPNRA